MLPFLWNAAKRGLLERRNWQRGTDGEKVVGKILATLPDELHGINDLKTHPPNQRRARRLRGPVQALETIQL
jgi:hypothetical protein